jgi:hypothetical protein
MLKRLLLLFFSVTLSLCLSVTLIHASAYQLTAIGSLSTTGASFSHIWYTNGNLTFTGIAPAATTVDATIDGAATTVTADASGNWSHPVALAAGDHTVTFAAAGTNFANFTLTIGEAPEGIGALQTSETPTAGSATPTIIIASIAGLMLLFGLKLLRTTPLNA